MASSFPWRPHNPCLVLSIASARKPRKTPIPCFLPRVMLGPPFLVAFAVAGSGWMTMGQALPAWLQKVSVFRAIAPAVKGIGEGSVGSEQNLWTKG